MTINAIGQQRWKKALAAAAVTVMLFLFSAPASASKPDRISFDLFLPPSLLGEGSSSIYRTLQFFQEILKKDAEIELIINTDIESWGRIITRLETDMTDVAWLPPFYYARARAGNPNSKIRPLVVYKTGNSINSPVCIYVRKDSGNKRLQDLLATKIYFPDEASWIILNHIFAADRELASYKIEPFHFFSGFKLLNRESAVRALQFKAADAAVIEKEYIKYMATGRGETDNIFPLVCTDPLPNTLIVSRNNMDARVMESFRLILTSMHRDSTFKILQRYFKTTKGSWTTVEENELKPWYDIYKESLAGGWNISFENLPFSD